MAHRSSGNLGMYEDRPPVQRWDRDKFEQYRRPPPEHDSFHFEEHDRGPHGGRRDVEIDIDDRFGRRSRAPPTRPRYVDDEDDQRGFNRRPVDFLNTPTQSEVDNRALAPYRGPPNPSFEYRRAPHHEPSPRRSARPQYIRRQSSLDTFDRKPYARYGDHERDEWRPPVNVPIPLPIRSQDSRSAANHPMYEYEEVQYRNNEPDFDDYEEDYRDIRIHRRRRSRRRKSQPAPKSSSSSSSHRSPSPTPTATTRKSSKSHKSAKSHKSSKSSKTAVSHKSSVSHKSGSTVRAPSAPPPASVRSSSSSSSSRTASPTPVPTKKGRTKMPKRLVHVSVVMDMGYPYVEEDDFIVVHRALGKEQIDEVIRRSEVLKEQIQTTTYRYENTGTPPAPPPPPSVSHAHTSHRSSYAPPPPPPPPESVSSSTTAHTGHHTHRTHRTSRSRSSSMHHAAPPPPPPASSSRSRRTSPARTMYEERFESNHVPGPLTSLVPGHQHHASPPPPPPPLLVRRRSESSIREDIRSLELERQDLRSEREHHHHHHDHHHDSGQLALVQYREYEPAPSPPPPPPQREVVRVEKDRKAKVKAKRLAAMMSTLT